MEENLYGSLCLSDIPKELITVGKNGKKYLNIVVNKRREVSQFGMTHIMSRLIVKKEQQREGVNYYIGELKPSSYQNNNAAGQATSSAPGGENKEDDLPF